MVRSTAPLYQENVVCPHEFHPKVELAERADSVTDVVALIDPDNCIRDDEDKRRYIPRMWHHVANGVFRFSEDQLAKMEKGAPGTVATLNHVFWRLLADEPLERKELIDAIRRLPNAFVGLLLRNPNPRTGDVLIRAVDDYELFAIESLGSLDAVAALLAASHLHEEIGYTDTMLDTARSGVRLFLRIALHGPLARHLEQIWPFLERRYVARLQLYDLKLLTLVEN